MQPSTEKNYFLGNFFLKRYAFSAKNCIFKMKIQTTTTKTSKSWIVLAQNSKYWLVKVMPCGSCNFEISLVPSFSGARVLRLTIHAGYNNLPFLKTQRYLRTLVGILDFVVLWAVQHKETTCCGFLFLFCSHKKITFFMKNKHFEWKTSFHLKIWFSTKDNHNEIFQPTLL